MNARTGLLAGLFAVLALPLAAAPTAGPSAGASAAHENLTLPEDLRPENPVVPQINLPLGRTPPAPVADARHPAGPGRVDDAVARCQARKLPAARAECLRRLKHQAAPR